MSAPTPRDERTGERCHCGHARDEHTVAGGICVTRGCLCILFQLPMQPPTPPSRPALLERVRSAEGETRHIFNEHDDCVSWCPACLALRKSEPATPAASGALPPVPVGHPHEEALWALDGLIMQEQTNSSPFLARDRAEAVAHLTLAAKLRASYLALLAHDGATPEGGEAGELYDAATFAPDLTALRAMDYERGAGDRSRKTAEQATAYHRMLVDGVAQLASALATAEAALAAERERAETAEREADVTDRVASEALADLSEAQRALVDVHDSHLSGAQPSPESFGAVGKAKRELAKEAELIDRGMDAARAALASSRAGTTGGATTDG